MNIYRTRPYASLPFPELMSIEGLEPSDGNTDLFPRGSAFLTNSSGCGVILHACSGSHNVMYHPTLRSITDSVYNALVLAERNRLASVIMPVIGTGHFAEYLSGRRKGDKIPYGKIVNANLKGVDSFRRMGGTCRIEIRTNSGEIFAILQRAMKKRTAGNSGGGDYRGVTVKNRSLVDVSGLVKGTYALVNAANVEGRITNSGGIAAAIAALCDSSREVDAQASQIRTTFWKSIPSKVLRRMDRFESTRRCTRTGKERISVRIDRSF